MLHLVVSVLPRLNLSSFGVVAMVLEVKAIDENNKENNINKNHNNNNNDNYTNDYNINALAE